MRSMSIRTTSRWVSVDTAHTPETVIRSSRISPNAVSKGEVAVFRTGIGRESGMRPANHSPVRERHHQILRALPHPHRNPDHRRGRTPTDA